MESRRNELKQLNESAWDGEDDTSTSKYDSSLKKNTAFVKKIKTCLNSTHLSNVLKDIETLSLTKYLSEMSLYLSEGLVKVSKPDDIAATVEIISKLHQRFASQFTPILLSNILIGILQKKEVEEEAKEVITKRRNLLRLLLELTFVGVARDIRDIDKSLLPENVIKVFNTKDHISELLVVIMFKAMLYSDLKKGNFLPALVTILKKYHDLIPVFIPEKVEVLRTIFETYAETNIQRATDTNTVLNKAIKDMNKSSLKYGKVFDERFKEAEELREYFCTNTKSLCDILGIEFPQLEVKKNETESFDTQQKIELVLEEDLSIWDSKEEERFYTVIPRLDELNLRNIQPFASRYNTKQSDGDKVGLFLEDLTNCNDENLEYLVEVFNKSGLNNKATIHRFFKFCTEASYANSFKYISKFLKINYENLTTFTEDLVEFIDVKLKSQIHFESLSFKYIFFYIELIKLKLIPKFKIFHKLTNLTKQIESSNNLDVLTVIYENCGKFLLHDTDFRESMIQVLDILKMKKKSAALSIKNKMAISNLISILEVPKKKVTDLNEQTKLTPEQQFLIRLVKNELNSKTHRIILRILSSMDLSHIDYSRIIIDLFTDYKYININNVDYLALLLKRLVAKKSANTWILIRILDELVENIVRGIELNDYRMNKERVTHIKLIPAFFNCYLVNIDFILDLSLKILYTGHPNNAIIPYNYDNQVDPPNNSFKISLVCVLYTEIEVLLKRITPDSNMYHKKVAEQEKTKKKLEEFLILFQYYIFCKEPVSRETEFQLSAFFDKFQGLNFTRMQSLQECIIELKALMETKKRNKEKTSQPEEIEHHSHLDVQDAPEDDLLADDLVADGDDEAVSDSSDSSESSSGEDSESEIEDEVEDDGDSVNSEELSDEKEKLDQTETEYDEHPKSEFELKFDQDLKKQFSLLSMEPTNQSHHKRKPGLISVPKIKSNKFSIIMRDGKKTSTKEIAMNDQNLIEKTQRLREEKERVNNRILNLVSNMQD